MSQDLTGGQRLIDKHGDTMLAAGLAGVVVALIVPLPTFMLDLLLTLNFSYVLLLMALVLTASTPLDLSTFPSLLLMGTLFRLALNVASTRLILLQADAGTVIESFGEFVVGGEMIVGLVIFCILVAIQFIVITKGSERISEVAARFTLDAMPGKQMSIDADLNAGLIDGREARDRRERIVQEADFYGAMDGASKYVRGDAIAGIIIILINIVGGIGIGLTRSMSIGEAVKTYSLLTVGDGLVTQIPAVIMSTAAGILVTKSGSTHALSKELGSQVFARPRALGIAAVVIFGFMLMPGLPFLPFLVIGACLAGACYFTKQDATEVQEQSEGGPEDQKPEDSQENVSSLLLPDRVSVEVGYDLIRLIDPERGGTLLDRIKALRRKFAREMGIVIPKIRIVDNVELKANNYVVKLSGESVASGELYPGRLMAMKPDTRPEGLKGIETTEPSFGLPVVWISEPDKNQAEREGCTVVDPESVFITHMSELIRTHAHEILARSDVKELVDNLRSRDPELVDDIVPDSLSLGDLQQVLANLLKEGIPVRDLAGILEAAAVYAQRTESTEQLAEMVRKALHRTICAQFADDEDNLHAFCVDPALEEQIRQAVQSGENGSAALPPAVLEQIISAVSEQTAAKRTEKLDPVIVTAPDIRRYFRDIVKRVSREIPVIAYDELCEAIELQTVGMISLEQQEMNSNGFEQEIGAEQG